MKEGNNMSTNFVENNSKFLVLENVVNENRGFRTFLRGQNVPLEPEIKAARENKRIKALELQSAILNQLEDREKRRIEEREFKLREERLEELRIQRQQEEDRMKLEEEKRKNEEKQLQEQRKLDALKKALEDAERTARQEKEKRFTCMKKHLDTSQRSTICDSGISTDNKVKTEDSITETMPNSGREQSSPTKTHRTYDVHSAKSQKKDCSSHQTTEFNSPRSVGPGNLNLFIHSVPPLGLADNQFNIVPIGINGNCDIVNSPQNNIQLAVLVPQTLTNNLYSVSLNSLNNINDMPEANKLLTPKKYRTIMMKDATTQTDSYVYMKSTTDKMIETDEIERDIDKNYPNIDENAPQDSNHNTLKKDRRFRSEERFKKDLENRPKWGVNRPIAQYKKQSEKDPFYSQKRKVRQKYRPQPRQYLSQSSEDSRSPSPLGRPDKTNDNGLKLRHSLSQSYWRNKRSSQDLSNKNNQASEPINSLQIEFNHIGQITANELSDNKKSPKNIPPNKRMTLSQKFINDKYGNRKLWNDDVNERNIKVGLFDVDNRKKIIDQINTAKRDYLDKSNDQENFVLTNQY